MFTHNSSVGKPSALQRTVSLVFVLGLVAGALLLLGCGDDDAGGDIGEFAGTWASTGSDQFIINKLTKEFVYSAGDPTWGMDYTGTIVGNVATNENLLKQASGYLTLQITASGTYGPTVGKYFRIFWKDLTTTTVQEAGAYKSDGSTGTDSISAAETEFTVENGYFDQLGTYTKQ